ncbi:MAG: cytochrome-c oxidase, cbb3-type subunit III, partial [Alphaproteobacteria bacterium]|nr:cytochrome-c oxidase, cbb3-type subunit III [Alphaproteobacteria bacterium]
WSLVYFVLYPAWPTLSGYTKGVLGYSQRATVADELAEGRKAQAGNRNSIAEKELADISRDPELLRFSLGAARIPFAENCAPCHGRGGQGGGGYPNLADDEWLWGGKIDDIHQTIQYGIRWNHDQTRMSAMPRFGLDELLEPKQINDAAEYVLSLTGQSTDGAAAGRGKEIFAEQCAACHGENGKGNTELGAPDLTDQVWLYGGTKQAVVTSIRTGRGGRMPNWAGRLDPVMIKALAVYVHSLGGGK